jgi:hypothetical protein
MKTAISCVLAICMAFFALNAAAYNLPDTGQTKCYDDTKEIPCPKPLVYSILRSDTKND